MPTSLLNERRVFRWRAHATLFQWQSCKCHAHQLSCRVRRRKESVSVTHLLGSKRSRVAAVEAATATATAMRKKGGWKDSLKSLEADIHHANIVASDFPRDHDGVFLQMRLSYSPAARFFLFFVRWADCRLVGALGMLRVFIYKAYIDGKTAMFIHEREASIRQFYGIIFPSLMQLQSGISDLEERNQREACMKKYKKQVEIDKGKLSEADLEREEECGICMELNSKIVLPTCNHVMCMKCYHDWCARSQSCPFCRESLESVSTSDLWIYTDNRDIVDMALISKESITRLFMYVDKLPLAVPDPGYLSFAAY